MNHDEDGCHGATRVIDAPQHALIVAIFSNLIEGLFIARGFLPPPTVLKRGQAPGGEHCWQSAGLTSGATTMGSSHEYDECVCM